MLYGKTLLVLQTFSQRLLLHQVEQALLCSGLEAYIGSVIVVVYKSKFDSSIAILSTRNIKNNEKYYRA